jgi:hypothetical protein
MKNLEKSVGNEYACGHPLASGGRCTEPVVWGKPCPVHRTRTFEQHPLPARKCRCEQPLASLPDDGQGSATCVRCGRALPDIAHAEVRTRARHLRAVLTIRVLSRVNPGKRGQRADDTSFGAANSLQGRPQVAHRLTGQGQVT